MIEENLISPAKTAVSFAACLRRFPLSREILVSFLAVLFALFLSACGGGGGGNAPDTTMGGGGGENPPSAGMPNPPPSLITQAEQAQARQEVAALRAEAHARGSNAELLRRIARLESDVEALRRTLSELRREIALLRADLPAPTPAPALVVCTGTNEFAQGQNCVCVNDYQRHADGNCYHSRTYALTEIGARYAHSQNYRGEGVTVFVSERRGVLATHEDLSPNIITLAAGKNKFSPNSDEAEHATNSAGLIAGLSTGVAISAKMVFPNASYPNAADYTVQIISRSVGSATATNLTLASSLAEITIHSAVLGAANEARDKLGDTDIVWVNSNGNNTLNAVHNSDMINAPNLEGAYPLIATVLADNLLMVTALNRNTVIAFFANGCGYAKMWCISAFGDANGHRTTDSANNTAYINNYGGTSAAAPHVAGALAVLKSAADDLHSGTEMTLMTNVRLILLETATDLGDEGVDEVYGWGLVNISAGITHLQGIKNQMSAIESMGIPRLGGAAAAANSGKFAAATGESFRFWGGLETESVYGGLATKEYGGISAFGEVGNSALEINSFLANGEVQNAESESWTAGIQRGNIWRHNDNLQISARQESRISEGELILQYSFGKQIRIPIKQKPATIWTAAYSQESDNGKWTAAMEWNALTEAKGFSFAAEIDL